MKSIRLRTVFLGSIFIFTGMCILIIYITPNKITEYINFPKSYNTQRSNSIYKTLLTVQKPQNNFQEKKEEQIKTIIISTVRSGSSWIGKLFHEIENSFYLFEPIHAMRINNPVDYTTGFRLVEQLLHCGISDVIVKEARQWAMLYNPRNCKGGKDNCTTHKAMAEACNNAKYSSMKIVRLRLSLIGNILNQKILKKIKIVFLVRDPRGTMNSIYNLQKYNPGANFGGLYSHNICARLREDINSYKSLSTLYPNNFHLVRYEDMARNFINKSKEMWRFINDNKDIEIPTGWYNYIKKTNVKKKHGNDAYERWELWRQDISEGEYNDICDNCEDVIKDLGYRSFKNYMEMIHSKESSLSVDN